MNCCCGGTGRRTREGRGGEGRGGEGRGGEGRGGEGRGGEGRRGEGEDGKAMQRIVLFSAVSDSACKANAPLPRKS